jgi:PelA/Pel-15E family pectate lyase
VKYLISFICTVFVASAVADDTHGCGVMCRDARATLVKAVTYHNDHVATNGGYLWKYTADLTDQWGEGHASSTQVWVQPPGTPRVGRTYLQLWRTTGDSLYLQAAKDAADALIQGQLVSGGWAYSIGFSDEERTKYAYRVDGDAASKRNISTLDDNTTQEATRLLIEVDAALAFTDPAYHEAAGVALDFLRQTQYENGAWPQRYPLPDEYGRYYTFNDNTLNDCIDVMLLAWETYDDEVYLSSALAGGDFIIESQIAAPQTGWAQQYSADLKPAWARSFEPPAVCSAVTLRNIHTLIDLHLRTSEERFLAPIETAIEWLESSVIDIPDHYHGFRKGTTAYERGWARLYEVGTNRPIFGDRDSKIHYTFDEISEERKRGYSWYRPYNTNLFERYRHLSEIGREAFLAETNATGNADSLATRRKKMEPNVRRIIAEFDDQGRWVDNGMILMKTYVYNLRILDQYISSCE